MSFSHASAALIAALGQRFGIAELACEEASGRCVLYFDRRLRVNLAPDPQARCLLLIALVGTAASGSGAGAAPHTSAYAALRGAATLLCDTALGGLVLSESVPIDGLTAAQLESRLNEFVDTALGWMDGAGALSQDGEQAEQP